MDIELKALAVRLEDLSEDDLISLLMVIQEEDPDALNLIREKIEEIL